MQIKDLLLSSSAEESFKKQLEVLENINLNSVNFQTYKGVDSVVALCSFATTYEIPSDKIKCFDKNSEEKEKTIMMLEFAEIKGKIRSEINRKIEEIAREKYAALQNMGSMKIPNIFREGDNNEQ